MNEKNSSILIDEYIDLNEKNLEKNFEQKCNLNETSKNRNNDYELVEGDDEQTDEQTDEDQSKLNKTDGQKRRRKSSGRQNTQSSHALHSSSSSLNSWTKIHLPESTIMNNQTIINNQILNSKKNGNNNLNSSYDTISEEEHRAKQIRQKLKTIDDDNIVSSSCDDDNDKLEMNKSALETNNCNKSSKTKPQHSSADSLSSSPTQQDHIKASSTNQNQNLMNNKTDQLNQIQQQRKSINHLEQQHCCFNHHHTNNNNYYYLNNHQTENIPWLYNNIQREEADVLLNKFINIDGVFLVRTSSKYPDSYGVLSFVYDRHIKHAHIRKMNLHDKTICFSLDEGKTKFYDIKQLIEFYQLNQYFLPTKLRYFLVHK